MDGIIGEIKLVVHSFNMLGYMECNGQLLSIKSNEMLFSLLSTRFGGNGENDFAIPKIEAPKSNPQLRYVICVNGTYPTRS